VNKSSKAKPSSKPAKPYPAFPLFAHASGRWGKKINRKIRFFGRWGHKAGSAVVPVEDVEASAAAAKLEFDRQWPYLREGRTPPPKDAGDGATIKTLCNAFLTAKKNRLDTGELTLHSFSEYRRTTDLLVNHFGRERRLDDLRPDDFEKFRAVLGKGVNVVTLKSKINRCRVVLNYAHKNRMIDRPIEFGAAFDRPSEKLLRRVRQDNGQRMFEADEIRKLLAHSDVTMKALILLGANCGYGNTDCASLPQSALDLDGGWIQFPRVKSGVPRRSPLWPETIAALRAALTARPTPKDPADGALCFLTVRGTRFVRVQESRKSPGHYVTINGLSRAFELLMERAGIEDRKGRGFYALRHGFETIAGDSNDQVATDALMGHLDGSMAGAYRERIADDRLRAVVEHVRAWLFGKGKAK
jgi:integrase